MGIPILSEIERLINEHGSAVILKERLALASDQYAALQKQVTELQSEKERLHFDLEQCQEQRRALEQQLSHFDSLQGWVEEVGALFKKRPDGSYDPTPYCPACKTAMVYRPGSHDLFGCGKKSCAQVASFTGVELDDVLRRLP